MRFHDCLRKSWHSEGLFSQGKSKVRRLSRIILLLLASLAALPAPAADLKADRILVLKQKHTLMLLRGRTILRSYPISLGPNPRGPKHWEGDGRTPEGLYTIDNRLAASHYHLALHISYPSEADRAQAVAAHQSPGGNIMIHGMPNWFGRDDLQFAEDWTDGCIAVSNQAIEEIWRSVEDGTIIEIRP